MRAAVLAAAIVLCVAVPAASASNQEASAANGSIAGAIAAKVAEAGANAAIAHFAPDLLKYTDPTGTQLNEIRDQLEQLDRKLDELRAYTASVDARLSCTTQRTHLNTIVASADVHLRELADISTIKTESGRALALDRLKGDFLLLGSQNGDLALTLKQGAIDDCARKIELSERPFLTAQLAQEVNDFYAVYETTHVSLLTVRANLAVLEGKSDETIKAMGRSTLADIESERKLIKPAFPNTESVDLSEGLVFRTRVAPNGLQDAEAYKLFKDGWQASIREDPRCLQMSRVFAALGVPNSQVRAALRSRSILFLNNKHIYCKDTHGDTYAYDVDTATFQPFTSDPNAGTVLAHHLAGFLDLRRWSYSTS